MAITQFFAVFIKVVRKVDFWMYLRNFFINLMFFEILTLYYFLWDENFIINFWMMSESSW